ncbi:DUF2516 family protein [Cellulomonas dongxiuzhuiae]|uniref:DUF2516 family protein n=1 Tax=Cellulomonas dongxiuzhuiae TaxID=2819979 RepID=A0ABX8GHL8_9CELL|nr:DUF2516 family protein [Cellulomonas dongxiuzhuiae]MBO3087988.1 DUF2516 family protein [Cellulomonas dongxiuzhuiae]MBO3094660.1 DUF2516 family protein [Cellulomonas dongxiuzhuiae]QWC15668.1 DUF2516 family protein [Cellulomonas dongxiuzhuiae]
MGIIGSLQFVLFLVFYVTIFALSVWALVDCLRRPAAAFVSAGKRTRQFWTWVLVAATVVAFISIPPPLGIGLPFPSFLALVSAAAAIVYLVDVRPAVAPYTGRRGGGPSRGGW